MIETPAVTAVIAITLCECRWLMSLSGVSTSVKVSHTSSHVTLVTADNNNRFGISFWWYHTICDKFSFWDIFSNLHNICVHTGRAPQYLVDSVQSVAESSRRPGLRSANTADYAKRWIRMKFGERCFSHAGPAAWNSLPASIKLTTDTSRFKNLLKSHLFHLAFWHFVSTPGQSVSCAL